MDYFIIIIASLSLVFYYYKFNKTSDLTLALPLFYNFVVFYVLMGTSLFSYAIEAPFDLYYKIDSADIYQSAFFYILSSFVFYIGGRLVKNRSNMVRKHQRSIIEIKHQKALMFFIGLTYSLYIFGYGIEALIYREGYIDTSYERNKTFLVLFFVLSPFATTLIPFLKSTFIRYSVYILCFLIVFSASSRFVIMLPLLYVVGLFLKSNKIPFKVLLPNVIILIVSLIFVLQIRNETYHGIIPNIITLFKSGIDTEFLFLGLNYALSFSLFGTSYVLKYFSHDTVAFLISINPLPSGFLDLNLLSSQRMIGTSPMSAVSILSLAGWQVLVLFYAITGYCFSFMLSRMRGRTPLYYAVVGLYILFTLFSIQYNLRGLSRFVYYSIIIFVFYEITNKIRIK